LGYNHPIGLLRSKGGAEGKTMAIFNAKNEDVKLDISWGVIFKLAMAFFIFYIVYLIRDILLLVLFGLIISVLFDPAIDFLQKFRLSRTVSVFLVFIFIFGIIGMMVYMISPIFVAEAQQFAQLFPIYFSKIAPSLSGLGFDSFQNMQTFTAALRDWLINASSSIFSSIAAVFGGIFLGLTVFTIAIFISLEERGIEKMICLILPKKYEKVCLDLWHSSQRKISGWFAVKLINMMIVGVLTALACWALDIKYPVLFGLLAAVTDLIPFVGPLVTGVFMTVFALLMSLEKAVIIALIFWLIHIIEGNVLTPLMTKRFIEFPAILVLISILIGEQLWGPVGAILAIPLFGILFDFSRDFLEANKD
jgi:predicted PurR-regulated permease PerM